MSARGIPEYAFNLQLAREIKQALVDAGGEPRSETKTQGDGGLSRCWRRSARIAAIRAITDHMAAQIGKTALDERGVPIPERSVGVIFTTPGNLCLHETAWWLGGLEPPTKRLSAASSEH